MKCSRCELMRELAAKRVQEAREMRAVKRAAIKAGSVIELYAEDQLTGIRYSERFNIVVYPS